MRMLHLLAQADAAGTELPAVEWSWLLPLIVLSVGGILLITLSSLVPAARGNSFPAATTAILAVLTFALLPWLWDRLEAYGGRVEVVGGTFTVDYFTLFITGILCIGLFFTALSLDGFLPNSGLVGPEWYVLLLMAAAGGVLMSSAQDLILVFVGLEILSIASYVLASLNLRQSESQEAGFKYFVLGALASSVLLYGIALVYGATGRTSLNEIAVAIVRDNSLGLNPIRDSSLALAGVALLFVGFAFKVSAAPFQTWTPDVYQGSPTPIAGFMASAVKVAAMAGFVRVFILGLHHMRDDWRPILQAVALLSVLVGAFAAVVQTDVKRMLAFSSISHAGFMLIAFYVAGSPEGSASQQGSEALLFYLLAYTVMIVGTFGVVTLASGPDDSSHELSAYYGLGRRRPVLAGLFAVLLFSQAGIPFTSGFFAKFGVILAAVETENYWLAAAAILAAVVAAYLYLRIVVATFMTAPSEESEGASGTAGLSVPVTAFVSIAAAAFITLYLGLFPDSLGNYLVDAAATIRAYNAR